MGANLSLLAPNAHTVAIRSYVDVLPNLKFLEVINNTRFLKTIKAYDSATGTLVVIKVFVKPPQTSIELHTVMAELVKEASLLAPYPNLLPWRKIIETDSAGYLIRQMVNTNLYDRLSLRPFLSVTEKRWIVFQMLKTIELLHDHLHICHGDLKTENFLVTSSNWLVLTDFAQNMKPVTMSDDNPSEFEFYFDSSSRRACYVAPERFEKHTTRSKGSTEINGRRQLTPEADLFSLGCVIAELYKDGEPQFTLSDLYRYKNSGQEPTVSGISISEVQSITKCLLSLDPKERKSASEILALYRGTFFPSFFDDFLYDFMAELNTSEKFVVQENNDNVSPSDLRLEKIYSSFDRIVEALDLSYTEGSNDSTHGEEFPYLRLNLQGIPKNHTIKSSISSGDEKTTPGALIVLDTVFALVKTVRRPTNKIKACELILALSEHISDEAKLDRSLPYLCCFLDEFIEKASQDYASVPTDPSFFPSTPEFSAKVASTSLLAMTNLLECCSTINPINTHVFSEFIYPKLKSLAYLNSMMREEVNYVKSTLSACLPFLTIISERFIVFTSEIRDRNIEFGDEPEQVVGSITTRCETDVKDITEALLTDSNINVRIRLIANILPVCHFFGVDKTNDIILPHLITYLNDSSFQLRLAFLSSIESIGNFIGVLAFEQYLLPLLVQTLGDHEPIIVLKVLEVFNYFVRERLINPKAQFNALSIYEELLSSTLMFLLQPNEWIRQSVVFLILSISDNLSSADQFCFLYPIIKGYLLYDIPSITWNQLYPCLTKPLTRRVFEMAFTWLTKSSDKSLFWKKAGFSLFSNNGRKKLVSFSKDTGKSIYLGKSPGDISVAVERNSVADASLSHIDRQWILKLKSIGMVDADLWKISTLRKYFIGIRRSGSYNESGDHTDFALATDVNIPPLNIFGEVKYKSEAIPSRQQGTVFDLKPKGTDLDKSTTESISGTLALPLGAKARASLQTNEANVFAELNSSHEEYGSSSRPHHHDSNKKDTERFLFKVFCTTNERIISVSMRHNFRGSNPHILSYLQKIDFRPSLGEFSEFGTVVANKENETHTVHQMSLKGAQVAHINTNDSASFVEAITKIALCPSSEFFVSGSETGVLKVYDTSKLETVSAKSAALSLHLGAEILDIVFLPHRFVFAVATRDGYIRLFRVQVVRGKNKKPIKFTKLSMIRSVKLEKGFAKSISFTQGAFKELMVLVTSTCQIVAYDIIKTEKQFELQNPPQFGVPNTFIISKSGTWLLLGTTEGVLSFWDLRFKTFLRSWKVVSDQSSESASEITALINIPSGVFKSTSEDSEYFAMIGGVNEQDVTIWEIPLFECREIYSADTKVPKLKKYTLEALDTSYEYPIEDTLSKFNLDFEQAPRKGSTTLKYIGMSAHGSNKKHFIVTSTTDNRIIVWDLNEVSRSTSLLDSRKAKFFRTEVNSKLSISYEKLSNESDLPERDRVEHDSISDMVVMAKPYPMIVATERNGSIRVYK